MAVRTSSGMTLNAATGNLETCSSGERSKIQSGSWSSGPMTPTNASVPRMAHTADTIRGATPKSAAPMTTRSPDTPQQRLGVLVGSWKTEGWTSGSQGSPATGIQAIDTYEWLAGGVALLHLVDARVGDLKVDGAEIIGYDPGRGTYVTQYFGSDGPAAYEAELDEEGGGLVWVMRSTDTRFSGRFSADGDVITGHWDRLSDDSTWVDWMGVSLTKQAT
jgi:hypothetical protein